MGGNGGLWGETSPAEAWAHAACSACKRNREALAAAQKTVAELEADIASRGIPNRRIISALTYDVAVLRRENAALRAQLRDAAHVQELREEVRRLRADVDRDAQRRADEMRLRSVYRKEGGSDGE